MRFADRSDAGRRLAAALARYKDQHPVILALPRGGVPVAYEIARALNAPFDLVFVRKIGAPFQPELAIGAIVGSDPLDAVLDEDMIKTLGVGRDYIEERIAREAREIERRRLVYLRGRPPVELGGKVVIAVDDGIATGSTMAAALRAIRRRRPASLIMAVPVAAPDALARLSAETDEIVCLHTPADLGAIGFFYKDFRQLEDRDVIDLLDRAAKDLEGRTKAKAASA